MSKRATRVADQAIRELKAGGGGGSAADLVKRAMDALGDAIRKGGTARAKTHHTGIDKATRHATKANNLLSSAWKEWEQVLDILTDEG